MSVFIGILLNYQFAADEPRAPQTRSTYTRGRAVPSIALLQTYDAAAVLQGEVRERLLARLDLDALTPRVVLDAGAGTGHASRALKRRYPAARVLAVDFGSRHAAQPRPARGRGFGPVRRICADAAPAAAARTAASISSSAIFMLPWSDPDAVFAEFRRVLAPRGLLTLHEPGSGHAEGTAVGLGAGGLVQPRASVHRHARYRRRAGAGGIRRAGARRGALHLDVHRRARGWRADLKAVGRAQCRRRQAQGLTGPRKFAAMQAPTRDHRRDGRLPATYEVVFGQAWAPAAPRGAGGEDNGVSRSRTCGDSCGGSARPDDAGRARVLQVPGSVELSCGAMEQRIELAPNCSLTPAAAKLFFGATCLFSLVFRCIFVIHGFWPVLPFWALEMLALGLALQRQHAAAPLHADGV